MKLPWMGEYRDMIEAVIGLANSYNQICNYKVFSDRSGNIKLTATEVQIIEYVLENEERNENMSAIAQRLSISQSTFSKRLNNWCKWAFWNGTALPPTEKTSSLRFLRQERIL